MQTKLVHYILKIEGMSCTSCEMRIENALKDWDGIIAAKANYNNSELKITFDEHLIQLNKIINAIEQLDYKVQTQPGNQGMAIDIEKKASDDKFSINQILGIGIILFALYLMIKNTVGFNFIPQVDQSMSYGILFVVGLLTSLHCIAMCGGINLSQCVSAGLIQQPTDSLSKLKPSFLYNLGRVISYTLIGGIVGALGSVVSFSGTSKGIVTIIAGVFMIIMGTNMLNLFPWLRKLNPRLPKLFGAKIHHSSGKRSPLYVGLLNGLMPCGPLQTMQIYALATGSFVAGATSMFVFSLGTVPLMFGFGAISSLLSTRFTKRIMKVSAILVIFLGVIMLNRGLNLGGYNIIPATTSVASASSGNIATLEVNVQTITTTMDSGKYSPIIVQKGVPVKWTITAQKSDLNGCNNPVTIPEYDKEYRLVPGDNLIEFTPEKTGNITYTCWMGMISSNIKVVDDLSQISEKDLQDNNNAGTRGFLPAGMGCCAR